MHWIQFLYLYQLRKLFPEALIVTEAIYDVRESHTFPRTFAPYFRKIGLMNQQGLCHLKRSKWEQIKQSDWSDFIGWAIQAIQLGQLLSLWRGLEKYFCYRVIKVPFLKYLFTARRQEPSRSTCRFLQGDDTRATSECCGSFFLPENFLAGKFKWA